MSKHFIHSLLAGIIALAVIAQPAMAQAPTGDPDPGVLEIHDTLVDFLDAVGGSEAVTFEDFNGQRNPLGSNILNVCDNPQHSRMGIPATSFINRCFFFGELEDGFSARIEDGGVLRVVGTTAFGGDRPTNVFGTFPGLQATLLDFPHGPTAVALDLYQVDGAPGSIVLEVFAFDGALMGSMEVVPPSVNEAAFAGFTTPAPIRRVRLLTTNPGAPEAIGEMYFGGGVGRLEANPGTLDFGRVALGDTAQTAVEIRNAGHLDLNLDSVPAPPAPFFLATDGCSDQTLARDETCTLEIGFEPAHAGDFAAAATVTAGLPFGDALELALAGQAFAPEVSVIPERWDFGAVDTGLRGAALSVRLANFESAPVTVDGIDLPGGPFSPSGGDCPAAPFDLAPGESCTLSFDYQPQEAGLHAGLVVVDSGGQSGARGLHLSGRGLAAELALTPDALDFGTLEVGESAFAEATVANNGDGELMVDAVGTPASPFQHTGGGTCEGAPFTLPPGGECTLEFAFLPDGPGVFGETVDIETSAGTAGLALSGEAEIPGEPEVNLSIGASLDFGAVPVGDSAVVTAELENTGDADLNVGEIIPPEPPFTLLAGNRGGPSPCAAAPFTLAPGGACTLAIAFDPLEPGSYASNLTLVSNAPSSPDVVEITGVGGEAFVIPTLDRAGLMALILLMLGAAGWALTGRRRQRI